MVDLLSALSVIAARCQLSHGESHWRVGQAFARQERVLLSGTVVPGFRGQQQLDKVHCPQDICPRKQGPAFCGCAGFQQAVQSGPACQRLSL